MSPLLQGNTGDYITPLISSNRDIEVQEVQEEVQEHTEEYLTPLISRTRDIEIYTQQPYSGQYSTVQYSTVQYSSPTQARAWISRCSSRPTRTSAWTAARTTIQVKSVI